MKNVSIALLLLLAGSSVACAGAQDPSTTGSSPTPTVTVAPVQTTEPVADKPKEDKPADNDAPPPPEDARPAGRLAFVQCTDESRKVPNCSTEARPVCAEVDTGLRCVRAPCPSMAQQTYGNACSACVNKNVRGYWALSCEDMTKPTAP